MPRGWAVKNLRVPVDQTESSPESLKILGYRFMPNHVLVVAVTPRGNSFARDHGGTHYD
jgi:hypothetical protein